MRKFSIKKLILLMVIIPIILMMPFFIKIVQISIWPPIGAKPYEITTGPLEGNTITLYCYDEDCNSVTNSNNPHFDIYSNDITTDVAYEAYVTYNDTEYLKWTIIIDQETNDVIDGSLELFTYTDGVINTITNNTDVVAELKKFIYIMFEHQTLIPKEQVNTKIINYDQVLELYNSLELPE